MHFRTRLTASLPVGGLPLGSFEFLEVCEASQVTFLNFFIFLQLTGMRLFLFSFSSVAHYATFMRNKDLRGTITSNPSQANF